MGLKPASIFDSSFFSFVGRLPLLNPASLVEETCHGLLPIKLRIHIETAWKPSPTNVPVFVGRDKVTACVREVLVGSRPASTI